jgi:hypothetical protein
MPSARRQALFAYFLSPPGQKVRRLAGQPAGFEFILLECSEDKI